MIIIYHTLNLCYVLLANLISKPIFENKHLLKKEKIESDRLITSL